MLQLDQITKSYTTGNFTQQALAGISISFRNSEFVAILGPSGSGKTTMLNIIGGLDHYDSGDLIIDGVSTKQYKDHDWDIYRNNQVGFVFQSYNLIPHQTVLSNVEMALTLSGVPAAERKSRALEALRAVGLEQHASKRPNQLSGGQAQRVAIARALVNNPTILLADEPTGALDSKTSVDVMNLLTDIAKDRLVVMVTHNPELAQQYATRIVEIRDGRIESDSHPYDPSTEPAPEAKPVRRTAMSLLTALGLSFQNLMTKKGRTMMTAFAGSIGIIGIALILSLATGAQNYINTVESDTLSEYPLQIYRSGFSFESMLSVSGSGNSSSANLYDTSSNSSDTIPVARVLTTMVSSVNTNDLASLKAYFDANGGDINDYVKVIEYKYGTKPLIYARLSSGEWQQVNPDTSTSAYTTSSYSSSYMSSLSSDDIFRQLPSDPTMYQDSYEILAGRWPESYNECILITGNGGVISDYMLYNMGLRDAKEMQAILDALMNGENAEVPSDIASYTYEDIMAVDYRLVSVPDTYVYDETYGMWVSKSDDTDYMNDLISRGERLTIVGIASPKEGSTANMLTTGINYLPALRTHIIEQSAASAIVQDQLANPDIDVLTGKRFDDTSTDTGLDLTKLFSVDENAFTSAFSLDPSALSIDISALSQVISLDRITAILEEHLDEQTLEELAQAAEDEQVAQKVSTIFQDAVQAYFQAAQDNPDLTPEAYFSEGGDGYALVQQALADSDLANSAVVAIVTQLANEILTDVSAELSSAAQAMIGRVIASLPGALRIDTDLLTGAIHITITQEDLSAMITSMMNSGRRTYASNLSTFNYADPNEPTRIDIYPKDFESKAQVVQILNEYNDAQRAAGEDARVITFTDIVGTLMTSVTDIIDVISYLLIAFVSISLIVSSIMIGVITYISVLERKKEIGILRALGARKRDISRVFNAETFIEGLIAGVLGVGLTLLIGIPINLIVSANFDVQNICYLPPAAAIALILISVLLTLVAGLIPSRAAAKADPVEALRTE